MRKKLTGEVMGASPKTPNPKRLVNDRMPKGSGFDYMRNAFTSRSHSGRFTDAIFCVWGGPTWDQPRLRKTKSAVQRAQPFSLAGAFSSTQVSSSKGQPYKALPYWYASSAWLKPAVQA